MTSGLARRALSAVLVLGGVLLFGLLAAVAASFGGGRAYAITALTCTPSGSSPNITATVTFNGDTAVTLSISGGNLEATGATSSTSVSCGVDTGISQVDFVAGSQTGGITLDQTGGIFPVCYLLSGALNAGPINVTASSSSSEAITFGNAGVSVSSACTGTVTQNLTNFGAQSVTEAGSTTTTLTVSAAGGVGTGSAVTGVTIAGGPAGTNVVEGYDLQSGVELDTNNGAGTFYVTGTGAGNKIVAGTGNQTFNITNGDTNPISATANVGTDVFNASSDTLAGGPGTETFTVNGNSNTVSAGAGTDTITINGNSNTLTGGSGTVTITGNSNTITAGSSTTTIDLHGTSNTFRGIAGGTYTVHNFGNPNAVVGGTGAESITVIAENAVSGVSPDQITVTGIAGGVYTFPSLPIGTTVTGGPGTESYTIQGVTDGTAVVPCTNGTTDNTVVCKIQSLTLDGSSTPSANTTFELTSGNSTNNLLNGNVGTTSFQLDAPTGSTANTGNNYVGGSGSDTVTILGAGSSGNLFTVGTGTEKFYDAGTGNSVDFSPVGASISANLVVNLAGSSETVSSTLLNNGTATVIGSGVTYTFQNSPTSSSATDFTSITGALNGFTNFLLPGSGGLTIKGQGTGNAATFFGNTGVIFNDSGALQLFSGALDSTGDSISAGSPFQIGGDQVLVGIPTGGSQSCSGTPIASFCDQFQQVFTATGPQAGFSTFYAGPGPNSYVFTDNGPNNTFVGSTGTAAFTSSSTGNRFVAGSAGSETFNESGGSSGNSIDFSAAPVGTQTGCNVTPCQLVVNVSGTATAVPAFTAAVINNSQQTVATYTFTSGSSNFTTLIGAAGGQTVFQGGSGVTYTYVGQGLGNSLDFSVLTPAPSTLVFDVTHTPNPQVTVGSVPETFQNITTLIGLSAGNTTFEGGSTGGYTFKGNGTGNQAVFSSQQASTTLTVLVSSSGTPVTTGSVTFTLAGTNNVLCSNVPVNGNGQASCYATGLPSLSISEIIASYTPPSAASTGSGTILNAGSGVASTVTTITAPNSPSVANPSLPVNQSATFTATVTHNGSPVTTGSVTFELAGTGQTLCGSPVDLSGVATCSGTPSPAGTYDLLAIYTPQNGTGLSGSVSTPSRLTVTFATIGSAVSAVGYSDFITDVACFEECVSATVQLASGSATGTLNFSVNGTVVCSRPGVLASTTATAFECQVPFFFTFFDFIRNGDQILATFIPDAGQGVSPSANASSSLAPGTTLNGTSRTPTSITLGDSSSSISFGTPVTFTAQVTVTGGVPAGQVVFSVVGGAPLCTVAVPASVSNTSAQLLCTPSNLPVGLDQVQATFQPTSSADSWSSAFQTVTVGSPLPTSTVVPPSTTGVTTTPVAGVVVNVSGSPYATTALNPVTGVTVPTGDVLVAAPPTGVTSCATNVGGQVTLGSFCDNLVDISVVTGSSSGGNYFLAGPSANQTFADAGTTGGDTIDFSAVTTSAGSPLTVDTSGDPSNFTASVSTFTYTFTSGGSNFTKFIGSSEGNTSFLASPSGGYSYTATGNGNSISYSGSPSGIVVGYSSGTVGTVAGLAANPAAAGSTVDAINGLTTIIGSAQGGNAFTAGSSPFTFSFTGNGNNNTFTGGSGTDTFSSNGDSNRFVAGPGTEIFNDPGTGNTIDFHLAASPVTVNVSGSQVGLVGTDTAASGAFTYTFTSFGNNPITFLGTAAGTTFFAGAASDTFKGTGADTLSFAHTSGSSLTIAVGTSGSCSGGATGQATLGALSESFCGIQTFDGLPTGSTTFSDPGTGGFIFTGTGTVNTADFSGSTVTVNANLNTGIAKFGTAVSPPQDTFTDISSVVGSSSVANTFVAGSTGPESFSAAITGNTLDLSAAPTGSSSPLTVNASGGTVGGQSNGTAIVNGNTYTFTAGNFVNFIGATSGNTHFLAPNTSGFSFTAATGTSGNSVDFSAAGTGVTFNYGSASNDLLDPNSAHVTWNGGLNHADIYQLTTVTGSSVGGNTFNASTLAAATYAFTGNGNGNTFHVGPGSETITDPGTGNTISFLAAGAVTVNVSGGTVGSLPTNEASGSSGTYTFGPSAATFVASDTNATTFYAGTTAGDNFVGFGTPGPTSVTPATLDFTNLGSNGGPLTICVVAKAGTCSAGQLALGAVKESFSNITVFNGLTAGNTTFVADDQTAGYSFTGSGTTNTADFGAAVNGITANLAVSGTPNVTFHGGAQDTLTGISTIIGSHNGGNDFIAGTTAETFKDPGTSRTDTIDFSNVPTNAGSPLIINTSSATTSGVASDTASAGGVLYNFATGGPDFVTFTGSSQGNTHFIAPKQTGGYSFTGVAQGNTADFSANTAGIVANMSPTTVTDPTACVLASGLVYVAGLPVDCVVPTIPAASTVDTVTGVQTVIGSPIGANTFYGGLSGIDFTAASGINTLSYIGAGTGRAVFVDVPNSTVELLSAGSPNPAVSDTYSLTGQITIEGTANNDTFRVGAPSTILQGGGGHDTLDLGALNGVTVDLQAGTISTALGTTFTPGCGSATSLCVVKILGSQGSDTYRLGSGALDSGTPALTIVGRTGHTNTLDLSNVSDQAATVSMPVNGGNGSAVGFLAGGPTVTFSGVANLIGTAVGGDHVIVGTGTESFTETGSTATLDFSGLGVAFPHAGSAGVTIAVTDTAGTFTGTATAPAGLGSVSDTFTGFQTFIGTPGNDSFTQNGQAPSGGYTFSGQGGANSVTLSVGIPGTIVDLNAPTGSTHGIPDNCTAGIANNDGTVTLADGTTLQDTFGCVGSISSTGSTFKMAPGQAASINGGGTGILQLINPPAGQGATINLLTGTIGGGAGYNFTFSGMSTIIGTPNNDVFIDGPGTFNLQGGGGSDTISFANATSAADVNLSNLPYTIPTGLPGAGTVLPGSTASGGFPSSTLTLTGISNIIGTTNYNDILVGPSSGIGTMTGGNGADRFVLTGAFEYIQAGPGGSTIDLSQLPGYTTLNLAQTGPQYFGGTGDGGIWILGGNISQVIASPSGSTLLGGVGTLTLQGGTGSDYLVAGSGNQTLIGGGGADTLIGGAGPNTLQGGSSPVTFIPGSGSDTLTSPGTGNTLNYANAPSPVQINLTSGNYSVPANEPFGGTTVPGQSASGGYGGFVNLGSAGISTVIGTGGADIFVSGNGDQITGGGGNDLFVVDGVNDNLTAGSGTGSTFLIAAGAAGGSNVLNGGGRATIDFSGGSQGVTVNLQLPAGSPTSGGFAGAAEYLSGFLNIVGTPYADTLVAGGPGAVIDGLGAIGCGSGSCGDFLEAGPTGGDTLEANPFGTAPGNNTFCAMSGPGSCALGGTTAGGGDIMIGGSGNDTFWARNGVSDTIYGEGGFNQAAVDPTDKYVGIQQLL